MNKRIITWILIFAVISIAAAQDEQPPYRNDDGSLNLAKIDDVANGINSGDISVDEFLQANPDNAQLENAFLKADSSKQSEIIGKKFGNDMAINGKINGLKDGVIETDKVSNFDLKQHKDFQGKITVNEDGSISMDSTNAGQTVNIGSESLNMGAGSNLKIMNSQEGSIALRGTGTITYKGTEIQGENYNLFIDSKDHSMDSNYVQFSDNAGRINVNADNLNIKVSEATSHSRAYILGGNNLRLINGGMSTLYKNNKILQETPLGMPIKNMAVYDTQNNDIFYMDQTKLTLGRVSMTDFLEGGKAAQIGKEIDVRADNRVIIRGKEITLPDGSKVKAIEYQLWTSKDNKLVGGMEGTIAKVGGMIEDDFQQGLISSTQKNTLKQEVEGFTNLLNNNKEYTINGEKYTIGTSNIVVREDGKAIIVPREGCITGKLWGNVLGTPNPNLDGPSLKVSPYFINKLYGDIQNNPKYANKDGTPKIPILN